MISKSVTIAALGLVMTMSGCGIYNSQFDCKPGKGLGCTSAWEVSEMIIENSNDEDPYDPTHHLFDVEKRGK